MPGCASSANVCRISSRFTPHAKHESVWSSLIIVQPRCALTSDAEHAVSITRLGPVRPYRYEMRPQHTLSAPCSAVYDCRGVPNLRMISECSVQLLPTVTARLPSWARISLTRSPAW